MPVESRHHLPETGAAANAKDARLDAMLQRFDAGEMRALAQLITMVENRVPESSAIIERIYPKTGHAQVVGITGPPGAGKSTLVNRLIAKYRALGQEDRDPGDRSFESVFGRRRARRSRAHDRPL